MFQIFKGIDGSFRFRLKSSNGEIILISESYSSKESCRNGIASVKRNAPYSEQYEKRVSKNGMYYFVLKARNAQIIGVSSSYVSKAGYENGKYAIMKNAPSAIVEDLT